MQSHQGFFLEAAEAYLFAAEACYLQEKFTDAASLAAEAWKTLPEMLKAGFLQAKYLAAHNQVNDAVNILEKIIRKNRFISLDVLPDLDLIYKPEVIKLLEKLRVEAFNEASKLLVECKKHIINESVVQEEIDEIEKLVQKKSFLHCKRAIDLLNENVERIFSDIFKTNSKSAYKANRNLDELRTILTEVKEKVKLPHYAIPTVNNLFSYLSDKTQWTFPLLNSSNDILNFTNSYYPKNITSNLLLFIKKEQDYYPSLPSAKEEIKKTIEEIYKNDHKKYNERLVEIQNDKNKASISYAFDYALS